MGFSKIRWDSVKIQRDSAHKFSASEKDSVLKLEDSRLGEHSSVVAKPKPTVSHGQ